MIYLLLWVLLPQGTHCVECPLNSQSLCNTTFSHADNLKTSSDRVIHIGVTLRVIEEENSEPSERFASDIKTMFGSILQLSTGATQHWIILTDKNSIKAVSMVLMNIITKHLTENIIRSYMGKLRIRRVPKVIIDYINIEEIPSDEKNIEFIASLQSLLAQHMEGNKKYVDKLFYLGPLYHSIFPQLRKLIFLDVGKPVLKIPITLLFPVAVRP